MLRAAQPSAPSHHVLLLWALVCLARVGPAAAVAAAISAVAQRGSCPPRRRASSQAEQPVRALHCCARLATYRAHGQWPVVLPSHTCIQGPAGIGGGGATTRGAAPAPAGRLGKVNGQEGAGNGAADQHRGRYGDAEGARCVLLSCRAADRAVGWLTSFKTPFHLPWLGGRDQAVAVGAVQARAAPLLDRQQAALRRDAHLAAPHQPAAARPGAEPPRAEAGAWQCRIGDDDCT